ncbi:MAG: VWA domain-containing protein [Caldilineaceae bacterium]
MKAMQLCQYPLFLLLIAVLLMSACSPVALAPAAGSGESAVVESAPRAPETDSAGSAAPASGYDAPINTAQLEPVTAGVTDDNEQWQDYLTYLNRHRDVYANKRDVSERYVITVVDETARPVHDATVEIYTGEMLLFTGRTDAGGRLLFHPLALDRTSQWQQERDYRVVARKGFVARSATFARDQQPQWAITLTEPERPASAQLDLLFLMDATGSMGDEIDKLKASMADIADQLATLPERPDVRYGLVAYRDQGDAFVVRPYDFTPDLYAFQRNLAALRADGGGDEPEALNEALHRSLNDLPWRNEDTVRLIILVADAPPHLDYHWEHFRYDTDMIEAVRRGIKIFPVGASNLNRDGEYIFRQLAQFTGGKFVFLTYAEGRDPSSGPGTETVHEVETYSVDTLDRLVVRLVRDELAKLSSVVAGAPVTVDQQQTQVQPSPIPSPTPTPQPKPQPLSCTIDLPAAWHDCGRIGSVQLIELGDAQALLQLTLDPAHGYVRARFDIAYAGAPRGWSVNLGDSPTNSGTGGDAGQQSNDAEVQLVDAALLVYGNDDTPVQETSDGYRQIFGLPDAVRGGETLSLEVANERLGINTGGGIEVITSPYLFALNRQPDRAGTVNYDLYAAFNRTIDGSRSGSGVNQVVVTLYPAR